MVTTRILTTRRRAGTSRHAPRRHAAWPVLASMAAAPAVERLRLPSLGRAYAAGAGLLVLVIAYLLISTQATQTSYQLDTLHAQNAQLQADQASLRVKDAQMHTQAGVAQSAQAAGLTHSGAAHAVTAKAASVDLSTPIGPGRPSRAPLWQQALAALLGTGTGS